MDNFVNAVVELLNDALQRNLISPTESATTLTTLSVITRNGDCEKLAERLDKAITRDRFGISPTFETDADPEIRREIGMDPEMARTLDGN